MILSLLPPIPLTTHMMQKICNSYANKYSIKFNICKSKCLYYLAVLKSHCNNKAQLLCFTKAGYCMG